MTSKKLHKPKPEGHKPESDLPAELARPARRALVGAGYLQLKQLTKLSEAEALQLHGMGRKALNQLRRALAAKGKSFAGKSKNPREKIAVARVKKIMNAQ